MRIVLLGPPGAGKGTQAKKISEEFGISHISTGEIFRRAIAENTPLGKEAAKYLDKGLLVPDEIVDKIVKARLEKGDCQRGFLLDGYPRTVNQAKSLAQYLTEENLKLDIVLNIQVQDEILLKRFTGRRMCQQCGSTFHIEFKPPKKPGICDKCGSKLIVRKDDDIETVKNRLQVYEKEIDPLIAYYKGEKLLVNVDGAKTIDEVFCSIKALLKGEQYR